MRLALPLALLLLVSLAAAQDARARDVSVVSYHVSPDPEAGSPRADPFSRLDTTRLVGAPPRLPLSRVDGVRDASDAPEGDPASAAAHFQELRRLVQDRQRQGSPVTLHLAAAIVQDRLVANASMTPQLDAEPYRARFVVIEDAIRHEGGSGIGVHRFVARAEGAFDAAGWTIDVPLDASWQRERLGLVVIVEWVGSGEVLQSATWLAGEAPRAQSDRAVLIEHVTATWCEPCAPRDAALDLLASQMGLGIAASGSERAYWRAPSTLALAGLALGAVVGVALVVRRRGA